MARVVEPPVRGLPRGGRCRLAIAATILFAWASLGVAGAARANVVWLCNPHLPAARDPCAAPLGTTIIRPNGTRHVETPTSVPARKRPVDCFYVYPTVSNQPTINANKAKDPPVAAVTEWQASRFSTVCRVFAPVYRQVTVAGLPSLFLPHGPARTAYSDVLQAWRQYLAEDNHGRGVILIGHSQGSLMLRELIRTQIDPNPKIRKLLVGAFIFGGNVMVRAGQTTGGDFKHIPLCTRRGQAGCVVAYSTWSTNPGPDAFVGNSTTDTSHLAFGFPSGPAYEVACTDPGILSGDTLPISITIPTAPFPPGAAGEGLRITLNGPVPGARTTWVQAFQYTGTCRTINGAHVFRYHPVGNSRQLREFPPTWGTHFMDINLGLQQLLTIAHDQTQTWLRHGLAIGSALDNRRNGTAVLHVAVPGAGALALMGAGKIRRVRLARAQPGPTVLRIVPTDYGRRMLEESHRLSVTVRMIYNPYVGQPISRTKLIHLVLERSQP